MGKVREGKEEGLRVGMRVLVRVEMEGEWQWGQGRSEGDDCV